LQRSWKSRRLSAQGAERQKALLEFDATLARAYAKKIPYECQRLIVSLNLLPHLAATGALGGRHVTILLNRSPLFLMHRQLDRAAALYPQSNTIGDFRAPSALVDREHAALLEANLLLTPHVFVAESLRKNGFPRVDLLPWTFPVRPLPHRAGNAVLFPASALARKGAYEVRAACRDLGLPLVVLGRAQEWQDFWGDDSVQLGQRGPGVFQNISCVVLPAHVENQPRLLLLASASGVPTICSRACGLPADTPGVTVIEAGDAAQLSASLARLCLSAA
jgi:glycosyltransferase involved in cell wall biosynthesis